MLKKIKSVKKSQILKSEKFKNKLNPPKNPKIQGGYSEHYGRRTDKLKSLCLILDYSTVK